MKNSLLMNEASSRTVLITGATGFIGSEMLVTLKTNGYDVRVYSRRPMLPKFEKLVDSSEWLIGELDDHERILSACVGVDIVVHLAGLAHSEADNADRVFQVNVSQTENIYSACEEAGVSTFMYVSSILASNPRLSAYAKSKSLAEGFIRSQTESGSRMRAIILRPANVYGAGMQGSLKVFIRLARMGILPSFPRLKNEFPMVSVGDFCRFAVAILDTDSHIESVSTYAVTDGQKYTPNRVEEAVYSSLGRTKPRLGLPRQAYYAAALVAQIMNFTSVWKNSLGLKLYHNLTQTRSNVGDTAFPAFNFRPTDTLESEMPKIISALRKR